MVSHVRDAPTRPQPNLLLDPPRLHPAPTSHRIRRRHAHVSHIPSNNRVHRKSMSSHRRRNIHGHIRAVTRRLYDLYLVIGRCIRACIRAPYRRVPSARHGMAMDHLALHNPMFWCIDRFVFLPPRNERSQYPLQPRSPTPTKHRRYTIQEPVGDYGRGTHSARRPPHFLESIHPDVLRTHCLPHGPVRGPPIRNPVHLVRIIPARFRIYLPFQYWPTRPCLPGHFCRNCPNHTLFPPLDKTRHRIPIIQTGLHTRTCPPAHVHRQRRSPYLSILVRMVLYPQRALDSTDPRHRVLRY